MLPLLLPAVMCHQKLPLYDKDSDVKDSDIDNNGVVDTHNYMTNDGIVEGVWILSRHGDPTPSRPLSPDHRRDEEAAFWVTKLPRTRFVCHLSIVFPDISHSKYIHCHRQL
jgi:hypothetical protein